jgi:Mg-chelatase subunit ChlD
VIVEGSSSSGKPGSAGPPIPCDPRERQLAIAAVVVSTLIALMVLLLGAVMDSTRRPQAKPLAGGAGTGEGTGLGRGTGTGSGLEGDGPGSGGSGDGRGNEGPSAAAAPKGERDAETVAKAQEPGGRVGPPRPQVRYGFSVPSSRRPAPVDTPVAIGDPDGAESSGASGVQGGKGSDFMGIKTSATHVVYVIDRSGSMTGDRFPHACLELKRSIGHLPTSGSFSVIFFDNFALPMPPAKLVKATKRSKEEAARWIDSTMPGGGTDPVEALKLAFAMKPQAIYLMTDGVFQDPSAVKALIDSANSSKKVSINTIAFYEPASENLLKTIARENRGDYRYVDGVGGNP